MKNSLYEDGGSRCGNRRHQVSNLPGADGVLGGGNPSVKEPVDFPKRCCRWQTDPFSPAGAAAAAAATGHVAASAMLCSLPHILAPLPHIQAPFPHILALLSNLDYAVF